MAKGRKPSWTPEMFDEFIKLYNNQMTYPEIAEKMGVSEGMVVHYVKVLKSKGVLAKRRKKTRKTVYAVYMYGEKFVTIGTVEEIAEEMKVKPNSVMFWACKRTDEFSKYKAYPIGYDNDDLEGEFEDEED